MKFRFILLFVSLCYAYDRVQAESQTQESVTLEEEQYTQEVTFTKPFPEAPVIYLTLTKLAATENGFEIDIVKVTEKGFMINYSKFVEQQITIQVQWLAIFDPRVQVAYYTSFKQQLVVPVYEDNFAYSVIGLQGSSTQLGIKVVRIDNGNAYLQVTSPIKMIKLCIISGSKNALYPKFIPFQVSDGHPWLKQQKGKAFINFSYDLSVEQPILIGGITEFAFKSSSMKINLQNIQYDEKVLAQIGTWNDAQLVSASVSILAYIVDPDLALSDSHCVELFEECYFQGKSVKICKDGEDQQLSEPFSFKSFMVPRNKQFELLNKRDTQLIMGIESCIDQIILQ